MFGKRLVSCVPNFSEGRNKETIEKIAEAIRSVEQVKLLDVDAGRSTNRTVYTFVGEPEWVIEAAYRAIQVASDLIDMRKHQGEHPRIGATDVCPIVPIQNITIQECVTFAHQLAKRVGETLHIPVCLYEYAATAEHRKNLANIRQGEYEGFAQKMLLPEWKPDYGPHTFNEKSGATVIGVRDFLVAYNVNLNTTSVKRANSVAFDVREIGRFALDEKGNKILDENGNPKRIPGKLKHCKGMGWYVEEYGFAQVSMNLTNIHVTNLHDAFYACEESAFKRGLRVTGSEIIGLVPKKCLIDAAKFYLQKQNRSTGLSEEELIQFAIHTLGLNEIRPFDYRKKIIEYAIEDAEKNLLVERSVKDFVKLLASERPAPGGGTASAILGAIGAALGAMVANLSPNKKGWENQTTYFASFAEQLQNLIAQLLYWADEDSIAYQKVMEAYALPQNTPEEQTQRIQAIEKANQQATYSPLQIATLAAQAVPLVQEMLLKGNPNSISDAAVGIYALFAAIHGAILNVKINLPSIQDPDFKQKTLEQIQSLEQQLPIILNNLQDLLKKHLP